MSAATEVDKMAALATAANEARGLAMDSIAAAHSGHMGLPLGCAEIGSVLYGSQVSQSFAAHLLHFFTDQALKNRSEH
jgi:transketolase